MELLKETIRNKGIVKTKDILKVDSFLNHQIDVDLMNEIGKEFANYFKERGITKVVTIESSGIAPSVFCAKYLHVPVLFIKKAMPSTMENPAVSTVFSFTKNKEYTICLEKKYLNEKDKVLFIDDFLANGQAFIGAKNLIESCKASIEGVGIVIEKGYQSGGKMIREMGYDVYSLAIIDDMDKKGIVFHE